MGDVPSLAEAAIVLGVLAWLVLTLARQELGVSPGAHGRTARVRHDTLLLLIPAALLLVLAAS